MMCYYLNVHFQGQRVNPQRNMQVLRINVFLNVFMLKYSH
jgi:hypothetical protein